MSDVIDLIRRDYRARLKAQGIPPDPARRTPEQATVAALEFWAAQSQVTLDAGSLAQASAEGS
jgi:hypothetical protein